MYPILFEINGFEIRSYWVMALLGIAAGFFVLFLNLKKNNLSSKKSNLILLFALLIFVPFYAGARLGYLFEHNFSCQTSGLFNGFSLWWGLITATVSSFFIAKFLKLNVWETADYFAPSIAIGGFFSKLGCLLNGCCFGMPCNEKFFLGTFFQPYSAAGSIYPWQMLHPVQLYSALSWLLIFFIINSIKIKFFGEKIIIMSFLYSAFSLLIDFFRWHENPIQSFEIKIISIVIIVISITAYLLRKNFTIQNQ